MSWRYLIAGLFIAGVVVECGAGLKPAPSQQVAPNPQPSPPVGWDVFLPPVHEASVNEGTPTVGEWTRTGGPDDSLIMTGDSLSTLSGENEGKDTEFLVFAQTAAGNATEANAAILKLDGVKAAINLPKALPPWSTYLIWPRNSEGFGRPIAINRTEAWWLNPDASVSRSDLVSVYGRNLAHDAGANSSWIYLKPRDAVGQWIQPKTVNPYRVQFEVPSVLANGTYEVWVHNGHGGSYGWSGPLSLTVTDAFSWNGDTFNVHDYGAIGDGVSDDANAIRAAHTAALRYRDRTGLHPTLYFPAGTYAVRFGIGLESSVRYAGEGRDRTIIRCHRDFLQPARSGDPTGGKLGLFVGNGGNLHDIEVYGLTIDASENFRQAGEGGYAFNGSWSTASAIRLIELRVKLGSAGSGCVSTHQTKRLAVVGCEFVGGELFLYHDKGVEIRECHFLNANYQLTSINELSTSNFSISDCRFEDFDGRIRAGRGQGRLLAGNSNQGAQRHAYIGDNVTVDLGPDPEDNAGEQIICESNLNTYDWGHPSGAQSVSLTFPEKLTTDYRIVAATAVITAGKGMGQYRQVTNWDGDRTITVSPAWNVVPDSSSVVLLEAGTARWVIYRNKFDGKSHYASAYSAMTAIEPYGGCYEWIGDSNVITNMRTALYISAVQDSVSSKQRIHPCFFHVYANNRVEESYHGIWAGCGGTGSSVVDPGVGFVGNVFRNNIFKGMVKLGAGQITFGTTGPTTLGFPFDMSLFEHNLFVDVPAGFDADIDGTTRTKNTVLYNNIFDLGRAAVGNSFGIKLGPGTIAPLMRENNLSGFSSLYRGLGPTSVLSPPVDTEKPRSLRVQIWTY